MDGHKAHRFEYGSKNVEYPLGTTPSDVPDVHLATQNPVVKKQY